MGNPTYNRFGVDTLWFRNRIRDQHTTGNSIADKLGLQRSELSRKLTGKRRMTYDDAKLLANVLQAPLRDVLARGNVEVHALPPAAIIGRVDADGAFVAAARDGLDKPKIRGHGNVEVLLPGMSRPMLVPVLVKPTAAIDVLKDSLPGLVVTEDGRTLLRVIRSGSQAGRYDLLPAFGLGARENDVAIRVVHWVAPDLLG